MTVHGSKLAQAVLKNTGNGIDAESLGTVNKFTLTPLTPEKVYSRTAYLAHNGIDRDKEVFDDLLLEALAASLPGKGLFVRHPMSYDGSSAPGVGRWYAAKVVPMTPEAARVALREPNLQFAPGTTVAKLVEASFYVPRHAANEALIENIDAGVAGDVSIGFRAAERSPIKDAAGVTVAHRLMPPGEALEGSLVWLGAQPGARVVKEFDPTKGDPMDLEQLKSQVNEFKPKAVAFDAVVEAVGELANTPSALKQAVADAKSYRDAVTDDVIRYERLQKLIGDSAEEITAVRGYLSALPLTALSARRDALAKSVKPGEAQIAEGDPNATGAVRPDDQPTAGAENNPTKNALISGAK